MPLRTVPNRALHVGLDADDDVAVETGARRATLPNIADLLTAETAFRIEFCKPLSSAESSAFGNSQCVRQSWIVEFTPNIAAVAAYIEPGPSVDRT